LLAQVYEGMGRWDESENCHRQCSEFYPSTAFSWYFWCRRTGRGDVAEAKRFAEKALTPEAIRGAVWGDTWLCGYYVCEGRANEALELADKFEANQARRAPDSRCYAQMLRAMAALELQNDVSMRQAVALVRQLVADRGTVLSSKEPELPAVLLALCALLEGGRDGESDPADIRTRIASLSDVLRRSCSYFVGRIFESRNEVELAESFYRDSLDGATIESLYISLAGHRLALRHGTSRP
jgi:hypothetical protein